MAARRVLSLIVCLGVVGCGGSPPSANPTRPAAIATASPTLTLTPTVIATLLPPTPQPKPTPKPVPVPPKPSGVALVFTDNAVDPDATPSEVTMTVTWKTPRTKGLTIKVFGVNRCLRKDNDEPCLMVNTRLPTGSLEFITEAPARDGEVSWTWPGWDPNSTRLALMTAPGGSEIYSVVLAAYGPSGHSKFAIAVTVE